MNSTKRKEQRSKGSDLRFMIQDLSLRLGEPVPHQRCFTPAVRLGEPPARRASRRVNRLYESVTGSERFKTKNLFHRFAEAQAGFRAGFKAAAVRGPTFVNTTIIIRPKIRAFLNYLYPTIPGVTFFIIYSLSAHIRQLKFADL
jgi:hypothetical protein